MLTIKQYNVTLKRVEKVDLEEIRAWRNQQFIAKNMLYQAEISKEQQLEWFNEINNKNNYYFVILSPQNERVGLVNSKDVDLESGIGEGGIFILNKKCWDTLLPGLASLVLLNFSMLKLHGFKGSVVKVLKENSAAVLYNKKLGYSIVENLSLDKPYYWMSLTKESYLKRTLGIQRTLRKLYPENSEIIVSGVVSDINTEEINSFLV
jgi:hypothetical protein